MDFRDRKLPLEAEKKLRLCPIASVSAYALMPSPVYVYMKLNRKFVAVKAPLDFFTPEELERLRPMETFFVSKFVERTLPFSEAGRRVRALLSWNPRPRPDGEAVLPPAPYEISDAVLRVTAEVWGMRAQEDPLTIEPFFVAVFANELCDPLPAEELREARDASVESYELAIFRSSWATLLALTLGHCDLAFLSRYRQAVFAATLSGEPLKGFGIDLEELATAVADSMPAGTSELGSAALSAASGRVSERLTFRLKRVASELARPARELATIFGERGFVDG